MAKTRVQKEEIVQKLSEKLQKANSVVFADFKGMNMAQLSDLRDKLSEQSAQFSVTKNSLLQLASKNSNLTLDQSIFEGPIATLFAFGDEITPIKTLAKAIKDNQIGDVKGGIFEGEFFDKYKINKLAQLPSKEELRAKVVGSLGAPLYGIVGVLQANLRNLVYALEQIRVSKGGE